MSDVSAKQQVVDKIKNTTNILVTVSNNPSVDELSAALGLTLLLNKMKKHATAVFSGEIPPALTFLDPAKTFEHTVDSLRDFIIALDKEKADHLRYKVEGDVVKIFITPYRTTITSEDLDFSQGDYNVELVLALGVQHQSSLDKALEAHGRILDDAAVATIVAGREKSDLGSIGWRDESASSLSEMMVVLSDALKADKTFVDEQIATAFLSGIVAATERFSNNRTSARVMTMAAQLMNAGANQQLIASKFDEATGDDDTETTENGDILEQEDNQNDTVSQSAEEETSEQNHDGTTDLAEGESSKVEKDSSEGDEEPGAETQPETGAGTLNVSHEKEGTLEEVTEQKVAEDLAAAAEAAEAAVGAAQPSVAMEQALSDTLPLVVPPAPTDISAEELEADIEMASAEAEVASNPPELKGAVRSEAWKGSDEPVYGGTLSATTEAAAEEKRKGDADEQNKTILSHSGGYIADQIPTYNAPLNAASQPPEEQTIVNPLNEPEDASGTQLAAPIMPPAPTLMDLDQQNRASTLPPLPPLPDFSTLPPLPPLPPMGGTMPSEKLGDILPPAAQQTPPVAPAADPAQFRIPGQK